MPVHFSPLVFDFLTSRLKSLNNQKLLDAITPKDGRIPASALGQLDDFIIGDKESLFQLMASERHAPFLARDIAALRKSIDEAGSEAREGGLEEVAVAGLCHGGRTCLLERTGGHLDVYPNVDYPTYEKNYYLTHYSRWLEADASKGTRVDLASPEIRDFTRVSPEERAEFIVDLDAIEGDTALAEAAKGLNVMMLEMNGGIASSIGLDPAAGHSKGTGVRFDVEVEGPYGTKVTQMSILEAKMRSLMRLTDSFKSVHVMPLNMTILRKGWETFLMEPSLETKAGMSTVGETNRIVFKRAGIKIHDEIIQSGFPKVGEVSKLPISTGNPSIELGPGGHGEILHLLYYSGRLDEMRAEHGIDVLVVGNADGKQAKPHPAIAAKMVADAIPAALVSTDRTSIDAKGGIFVIRDGKLDIVEMAQAGKDQEELFKSIGLRPGDAPQPFNTNTVYINVPLFLEAMKGIEKQKGPEGVHEFLMPATIANSKPVEMGGEKVPARLLEGAVGSVVLKFDGAKLFNASAAKRMTQFTPLKTPIDYIYLFQSDVFRMDAFSGKLVPQVDEIVPPATSLKGWSGWKELGATKEAFGRPSMKGMRGIEIFGDVSLADAILRGSVKIKNETGARVDLNDPAYAEALPHEDGRLLLENVEVAIAPAVAAAAVPAITVMPLPL